MFDRRSPDERFFLTSENKKNKTKKPDKQSGDDVFESLFYESKLLFEFPTFLRDEIHGGMKCFMKYHVNNWKGNKT